MRLLVFGDSVPWGQGLLTQHKYYSLVESALNTTGLVDTHLFAHSGATIGLHSGQLDQADPEIPLSWPTIADQVRTASVWQDASLVLLNGGINDVDIRTILNPCTDERDLDEDIERYCHHDFGTLLAMVLKAFPKAIVVATGYYPILSEQSDWTALFDLLQVMGIGSAWRAPTSGVVEKITGLSVQFWKRSNTAFARTIEECQETHRAFFLPLPFDESNSVFASNPYLFGLSPISLEPEDEVLPERRAACLDYYTEPKDLFSLFQCVHASAGHPDRRGAAVIGDAIVELIRGKCQP